MRITLVRNATLLLELEGRRILVDPMLDPAGARPPIAGTANPVDNPTVELPFPAEEVVRGLDAVLVTHRHKDHFDDTAERLLMCHAIEDTAGRFLGAMLVARNLGYLSHVHSTLNYSRKLAALGRLMAGVAHEVKNPLNAMTIHLELLKQKLAAVRESITVPATGGGSRTLDQFDLSGLYYGYEGAGRGYVSIGLGTTAFTPHIEGTDG